MPFDNESFVFAPPASTSSHPTSWIVYYSTSSESIGTKVAEFYVNDSDYLCWDLYMGIAPYTPGQSGMTGFKINGYTTTYSIKDEYVSLFNKLGF